MNMYHRTAYETALLILGGGFKDGEGFYMTSRQRSGVWLTDTEDDVFQGAAGDTLLKVALDLQEPDIAEYEWVEDGKGYREWLIPAGLLNTHAISIEIADRDIEPDW